MRRRTSMKLRPVLDRLEEKSMASAGLLSAHGMAHVSARHRRPAPHPHPLPLHPGRTAVTLPLPAATTTTTTTTTTTPGGATTTTTTTTTTINFPGFLPRPLPTLPAAQQGTYTLGPASGSLVPPFAQVQANAFAPVPGAVYNVFSLTVRNGTSRTFAAGSGFSVAVSGQGGAQAFPQGNGTWQPGQVMVFYAFTNARFPTNFTFNLNGSIQQVPANLNLGIQYQPSSFPSVLNSIAAQSVGGRYLLT
jgi:hypothetical protein